MPGIRLILQPRNKRRYLLVFRRYISDKETFLHFCPKPLLFRKRIQLHRIYLSRIRYQSILLKPEDLYQVFSRPGSSAFHIKISCICTVNMPHDLRQISGRRFKQQMIMGVHQTEYMNNCIVSFYSRFKIFGALPLLL